MYIGDGGSEKRHRQLSNFVWQCDYYWAKKLLLLLGKSTNYKAGRDKRHKWQRRGKPYPSEQAPDDRQYTYIYSNKFIDLFLYARVHRVHNNFFVVCTRRHCLYVCVCVFPFPFVFLCFNCLFFVRSGKSRMDYCIVCVYENVCHSAAADCPQNRLHLFTSIGRDNSSAKHKLIPYWFGFIIQLLPSNSWIQIATFR